MYVITAMPGIMTLYPMKFKPTFKKRSWGGQKLKKLFGKDLLEIKLPMAKSLRKDFIIRHQQTRFEGLCPECA